MKQGQEKSSVNGLVKVSKLEVLKGINAEEIDKGEVICC